MASKKLIAIDRAKKIGVSLSGGGIRALTFHLGVLEHLAEHGHWNKISVLSSVSGGSLLLGLLLSINSGQWPDAETFLGQINTEFKHRITKLNLRRKIVYSLLREPWKLLSPKGNLLAETIEKCWQLDLRLGELPKLPEILINATTYETGKNWRFSREKMGDYITGYDTTPSLGLATAIAASAAYPGLIGPVKLKTKKILEPSHYPSGLRRSRFITDSVWLWDGGVYDNLGIEPLFKKSQMQRGIDYLIVSDGGASLGIQQNRWSHRPPFYISPVRLLNITTDQIRSLRARDVVSYFENNPGKGCFLSIARSVPEIYRAASKEIPSGTNHLSDYEVSEGARIKTDLVPLTEKEFSLLLARGYEVAQATIMAYGI